MRSGQSDRGKDVILGRGQNFRKLYIWCLREKWLIDWLIYLTRRSWHMGCSFKNLTSYWVIWSNISDCVEGRPGMSTDHEGLISTITKVRLNATKRRELRGEDRGFSRKSERTSDALGVHCTASRGIRPWPICICSVSGCWLAICSRNFRGIETTSGCTFTFPPPYLNVWKGSTRILRHKHRRDSEF